MSPKKSSKLSAGTVIRINDGVAIPECAEVIAGGWTGMIVEAKGRGADLKYIIQWDQSTLDAMPPEYIQHCESTGLFHEMACFNASEVSAAEAD